MAPQPGTVSQEQTPDDSQPPVDAENQRGDATAFNPDPPMNAAPRANSETERDQLPLEAAGLTEEPIPLGADTGDGFSSRK